MGPEIWALYTIIRVRASLHSPWAHFAPMDSPDPASLMGDATVLRQPERPSCCSEVISGPQLYQDAVKSQPFQNCWYPLHTRVPDGSPGGHKCVDLSRPHLSVMNCKERLSDFCVRCTMECTLSNLVYSSLEMQSLPQCNALPMLVPLLK
jgi:hypothetical protein